MHLYEFVSKITMFSLFLEDVDGIGDLRTRMDPSGASKKGAFYLGDAHGGLIPGFSFPFSAER